MLRVYLVVVVNKIIMEFDHETRRGIPKAFKDYGVFSSLANCMSDVPHSFINPFNGQQVQ